MVIGNVWDVKRFQGWQIILMLNQLEWLVREGALEMLRLKYVVGVDDGFENQPEAYSLWYHMLLQNREESDWGRCKRELVWEDEMKPDNMLPQLERSWGLKEDTLVTAYQLGIIKRRWW